MIEWALRSGVLILAGALLLKALRIKDASIRLATWTAILFGSLAIPVMTTALPGWPVHVIQGARPLSAPAMVLDAPGPVAPASAVGLPKRSATESASFDWSRAAVIVWLFVASSLLLRLCIGLAICRRLLRKSRAAGEPGIRESDLVTTPVTLGIMQPAIVLPADWRDWDCVRRNAVLAHERSHIERHDPAVQILSAIHRALLWFSPLSWFLHSRIVRVAEEASDDAAVAATGDRATYAETLLEFVRRATPQAVGVPMARYSRPDQRINRILDATSLSRGVTRWSAAAILATALPITCLTATTRPQALPVVTALPLPLPMARPLPGPLTIMAQAPAPPKPPAAPPAPPAPRPKFDVASIRPCDPDAAARGGRGGKIAGSTTRFRRNCVTVMTLIEDSYVRFRDGKNMSPMLTSLTKIEGGPAWLNSEQYTIEAEADGDFPVAVQVGPMMQALLEDRFKLRIRRETREGPAYALTAAKTGAKMQPAKEGACIDADFVDSPFPPLPPAMPRPDTCRFFWNVRKGPNVAVSARSTSMEDFAAHLTRVMDRIVVDKTGITGNVDFRFVYAPDDSTPWSPSVLPSDNSAGAEDPATPSIFTALQYQLGLKLEPTRAARD